MAPDKIRLVVLDMGSTLWEEVPDERAVFKPDGDGHGDVFYRIDSDHMYRYEGVSNRIFPGVRAMFRELRRRGICVSINSLNTPDAWRWIESDIYDLNADGFVKYSRIGEHPDPERRNQPQKTDIKGIWTAQIIGEWNHRAVQRICPGAHCILPPTSSENGMLDVLSIIDRINNGDPIDN
jgi:hypothetical protein